MPDELPFIPRRNPEPIDLGAINTDLELLIDRVARLPTRKEQALKPLYVMVGSAGLVILWIEFFWRHCLWGVSSWRATGARLSTATLPRRWKLLGAPVASACWWRP